MSKGDQVVDPGCFFNIISEWSDVDVIVNADGTVRFDFARPMTELLLEQDKIDPEYFVIRDPYKESREVLKDYRGLPGQMVAFNVDTRLVISDMGSGDIEPGDNIGFAVCNSYDLPPTITHLPAKSVVLPTNELMNGKEHIPDKPNDQ